jgi:hypothetical protein
MMYLMLTFLTLITPVSGVVSGGRSIAFNLKSGLIPSEEWLYVPGIPCSDPGSFTEITYSSNESMRVLSSGVTAGLNPLLASWVNEDGYAGYFLLGGFSLRGFDLHQREGLAASFHGATIDLRRDTSCGTMVYGEYTSDHVSAATGEAAGVAGISFSVMDRIRLGPQWCAESGSGKLWILGNAVAGPLTLSSGAAVREDQFRRRCSAVLDAGFLTFTTGIDEKNLFGKAEAVAGCISVEVPVPEWGITVLMKPSDAALFLISHGQGGEFRSEVQLSFHGITGGLLLAREHPGHWQAGVIAGINIGSAPVNSSSETWVRPLSINSSSY